MNENYESRSINKIAEDFKNGRNFKSEGKNSTARESFDEILEQEKTRRIRSRRIWELCNAFLEGNQWLRRDEIHDRIVSERRDEGEYSRSRVTANKIQSIVDNRVSKFIQGRPSWRSTPASQDLKDKQAARVADALLSNVWDETDMDRKRIIAEYWATISHSYYEVYWDDTAGDQIYYITNPETGEAVSPETQLGQMLLANGAELEFVLSGKVGVDVVPPYNLYCIGDPDPQYAHTVIREMGYTEDYVLERWGKEVQPTAQNSLNTTTRWDNDQPELVSVREVFIPECENLPDGFYMAYTDGETLHIGSYPYKTKMMPFFLNDGLINPGGDFSSSFIYNLIPAQKELNTTLTQINEYKNYSLYPTIYVPEGGNSRIQVSNKPGQVIYFPVNPMVKDGGAPIERQSPPLPPYVYDFVNQLIDIMSDIAGEHKIGKGDVPGRIDNAASIGMLMENEVNPILPYLRLREKTFSNMGKFIIQLCQQFMTEEQILEITGSSGVSEITSFVGADLAGVSDVNVVSGSILPRSTVAKDVSLKEMADAGLITPDEYRENIDSIGMDGIGSNYKASKQRAAQEIETLRDTGQPIPDPSPWDIDEAHVSVMDEYANSVEFSFLNQEQIAAFTDHYQKHMQNITEKQNSEKLWEITKYNLATQLKGPADPELISYLASAGGGNLSADNLAANEDAHDQNEQDNKIELNQQKSDLKRVEAEHKMELEKQRKFFEAELERQMEVLKAQLLEQMNSRQFLADTIKENSKNGGEDGEGGGSTVVPIPVPVQDTNPELIPPEELPSEPVQPVVPPAAPNPEEEAINAELEQWSPPITPEEGVMPEEGMPPVMPEEGIVPEVAPEEGIIPPDEIPPEVI